MSHTIFDDGHIASPTGYRATGISCGLKDGSKARDVALVYSLHPANVAAMFTTSLTKAAPVFLSQAILSRNRDAMRAILINSGQANAGTGQPGLTDAVECAKLVTDELEIPRDGVLVMSTGLIGVPLPMQKMREGIKRAVSELDSGGGRRAAVAMLTTDSRPKERVLRLQLREGQRCTLAGMAKGTRMIHPRLATMLCVITTDAAVEQRLLQRALQHSVSYSFNRMNVDGEASPNDAVIMLANGAADARPINDPTSREFTAFQSALDVLCADLAQQIVRDAAGSGKIIHIYVRGAADEPTALAIADKIAQSRSLRSALRRGMPEWGAVMAAVGSSSVELRPELIDIRLGSVRVLHEGAGTPFDMTGALQAVSGPEIEITVDLNLGPVEVHVLSCTWFED
ncbi:bifunctional glutamate N-acetyltransferase/amino-acid acetyltransferase ArgJ [Candidatus Viridilinea mediisalina]|uniref:Arginine biosynthesis bifunctional protein ArgJ n=1 Tax=Candidatus Viridilinea mediisalina TaxID=2024553 RepID=A0A2A6RHL7_9CHLR|nr:bifunctional glutamate N-acetyltransferase/amino-acid acetyltransferase ArgJ [Candidatus Viridilinea mediisalina]PDW02368.1 bifunctional ornithine acetyltransferase/N-acetylglutamate synthase [Candidatus Viridilinea mediisalina]